jgi:hypothetical protein
MMRWASTVATEFLGLFVDDASFAVVVLVWVILAAVVLPHVDIPAEAKGPVLGIGLAAILVESAIRRAGR